MLRNYNMLSYGVRRSRQQSNAKYANLLGIAHVLHTNHVPIITPLSCSCYETYREHTDTLIPRSYISIREAYKAFLEVA